MAAKRYVAGPSRLNLKGLPGPIAPGTVFEYDFGPKGPHGVHGAAREQHLLDCGAITLAEASDAVARPAKALTSGAEKKE
jgi:hypothetical protein